LASFGFIDSGNCVDKNHELASPETIYFEYKNDKKITEKRNNTQARSQGPSFSALQKETKTKDGLGTLPGLALVFIIFFSCFYD